MPLPLSLFFSSLTPSLTSLGSTPSTELFYYGLSPEPIAIILGALQPTGVALCPHTRDRLHLPQLDPATRTLLITSIDLIVARNRDHVHNPIRDPSKLLAHLTPPSTRHTQARSSNCPCHPVQICNQSWSSYFLDQLDPARSLANFWIYLTTFPYFDSCKSWYPTIFQRFIGESISAFEDHKKPNQNTQICARIPR